MKIMRRSAIAVLLAVAGCAGEDQAGNLWARLRDPRETVRGDAVWELQQSRDPRALPALLSALGDPVRDVRLDAAMVLKGSLWEGPDLVAALTKAIRDPDAQIREYAVLALGRVGDPAGLPALHQAKSDPEEDVRQDAVSAIEMVDFALQARDLRYHPPAMLPPLLSPESKAVYLLAHESHWMYSVSLVKEAELAEAKLSIPYYTLCERPEVETKGGYHGQADARGFIDAVHRRVQRDPRVLEDFRPLLREASKRFPPPPNAEAER